MVGLALLLLVAGPSESPPVRLRDIKPAFVQGGRVLRSRTESKPGLFVLARRYRGLNCPVPSRVGLNVNGAFSKLRVQVAVPDGGKRPVAFKVVGDGRTLLATPPLFPNVKPLALEVDVGKVLLLELVAEGEGGSRAAWLEGFLVPAPGRDLGEFRALDAPFSPRDYPAAFRRRVNKAIDKAVFFLIATQERNGSWGARWKVSGVTALSTLALLKAGVKPEEKVIVNAFRYLRKQPYDHTYSVSCLLMALEARYFPGGADEKNAYLERPKRAKTLIPAEEQVWIRDAAEWLAKQQGMGFPPQERFANPVWRYPQSGYDLSNTQYALFGLSAANRCGVPTRKAWLPVLKFLLQAQEKDGPDVTVSRYFRRGSLLRRRYDRAQARGFGYTLEREPTGSMTSAGLCSLILCHQALHRNAKYQRSWQEKTRAGIRDALAWLEEYYEIDRNPFMGDRWWHYYLYNLERAGVLLDQRYIGTRDWYREGSEELIEAQAPSGSVGGGPVQTSFALLFWKRATVPAITSPLK